MKTLAIFLVSILAVSSALAMEPRIKKDVEYLIQSGTVKKLEPELNRAYVDRNIWGEIELGTKTGIGATLGKYCGEIKGKNLNWVEIYDSRSGKRLAKWSETWGFKSYE